MFNHDAHHCLVTAKTQILAEQLGRMRLRLERQQPLSTNHLHRLISVAAFAYSNITLNDHIKAVYYQKIVQLILDWTQTLPDTAITLFQDGLLVLNLPECSNDKAREHFIDALKSEIHRLSERTYVPYDEIGLAIFMLGELKKALRNPHWLDEQKWALCSPYIDTLMKLATFLLRQCEAQLSQSHPRLALDHNGDFPYFEIKKSKLTLNVDLKTTECQMLLSAEIGWLNQWTFAFSFPQFKDLYEVCQLAMSMTAIEYEHSGHFWNLCYLQEPSLYHLRQGTTHLRLTIVEFTALFEILEAAYAKLAPYWPRLLTVWGDL